MIPTPTLEPLIAEEVYDVLVAEAGASDDVKDRAAFVVTMSRIGSTEYRFMGALGFGGKLRLLPRRTPLLYVDCYPEDLTPERTAIIERTNARLRMIGQDG